MNEEELTPAERIRNLEAGVVGLGIATGTQIVAALASGLIYGISYEAARTDRENGSGHPLDWTTSVFCLIYVALALVTYASLRNIGRGLRWHPTIVIGLALVLSAGFPFCCFPIASLNIAARIRTELKLLRLGSEGL